MSFDIKNKENNSKYCSQCLSKNDVEHVCSSQLLSDSVYTLSEMANEQLNQLETFSLAQVHVKCQQDLELWHSAAVNHLGQIFTQRLADLNKIYNDDLQPEFEKYKQKMIEQLKNRIIPKITKMLDDSSSSTKKAEQIQMLLNHLKSECEIINDRQWIHVLLPDIRNFSVPIRIAKMALAARLTDGEKDPLDDLSDEENKEEENLSIKKKKKLNSIDILEIFASNPDPLKTYLLETNSSTLAFSNKHILIHDNKKLILFDLNKKIYEIEWNDNDSGILVDICWMSSLSLFVILTIHSVYLYDPTKGYGSNPIKVESIKPLDRTHVLASLSPFDRDLYINYHKGVHIDHYRVTPTSEWILEKRFSKQ
ncbi:unnamed protein product [Rotaria magnacalcarata]|uniref:Uncharacterized protein n=1 Tax=Rotaria magnacalcarata TaxID=392030 RepID=A0A816QJ44_9BILA|nr:unnamed protein product [Rotaria magnacalcarata]CAF4255169.1 unnamed protein product [Rotaria magnacalcarata]